MGNPMRPEWIDVAANDIGNRESLGPNDSPFLRKVLAKMSATWLKGQPWCGSVMAYWMQQCGIPFPKDYYRALAWASWGAACGPVLGAVVVFRRDGGGHVGICVGYDDAKHALHVLGGNQRDAVNILPFDPSRVLAYRWPPGKAFQGVSLPMMVSDKDFSQNEA